MATWEPEAAAVCSEELVLCSASLPAGLIWMERELMMAFEWTSPGPRVKC